MAPIRTKRTHTESVLRAPLNRNMKRAALPNRLVARRHLHERDKIGSVKKQGHDDLAGSHPQLISYTIIIYDYRLSAGQIALKSNGPTEHARKVRNIIVTTQ